MALIKDVRGRRGGSGYSRLFQDNDLGYLISRIQAAVISSGSELEQMIKARVKLIENLDEFLQQDIMLEGVYVADKRQVKDCKTLDFAGAEPDFLIFKRRGGKQQCHVVELKDGDSFDTKKSAAEHQSMHTFISKNAQYLQYTVQAHFCCFNQNDKKAIIAGFKGKIDPNEAMTGMEFCELLELDYSEIVTERKKHGIENFKYFLTELVDMPSVREFLQKFFR